ncbi:hypothetical protein HU200_045060 [Digitaria exilis]|uniref:Alcohol dehydrogenase-like N-terminal domain-containing protein n=1 Tax=Digitaria exilis TaxID=1010633 RepID=A0A835EEW5_9POAL|nr:hypothetical protein HU200_045060 [Digitaria exilis]
MQARVVGVVTGVCPGATKFSPGDTVGVGYFVDSCRSCHSCVAGHENYCPASCSPPTASTPPPPRRFSTPSSSTPLDRSTFPPSLPLPPRAALCAGGDVVIPMVRYGLNAPRQALGWLARLARPHGRQVRKALAWSHRRSSSPAKREECARPPRRRRVPRQPRRRADEAAAERSMHHHHGLAGHPIVAPLLELLRPLGTMVWSSARPAKPLKLPAYHHTGREARGRETSWERR